MLKGEPMKYVLLGCVLLVGCGGGFAQAALSGLKALAPIAAKALSAEAERRGVEIDKLGALCTPMPDEYQPDDSVLVVCVAPIID